MHTTAQTIGMALYCLHQNPECKDKMQAEMKQVYYKESEITQEVLSKMDYTYQIFKETNRFYCPAPGPFARLPMKEHFLDDVFISKELRVRPNPMFNWFHPKYFEDPFKFDPDRWGKDGPATKID